MIKGHVRTILPTLVGSVLLAGCDESPVDPWSETAVLTDVQLVDTQAAVNLGFPLEFDQAGEPHVAYTRADHTEVLYARRIAGAWQVETVARQGNYWNGLALALNELQEPVLTYSHKIDSYSSRLEIAFRSSGVWSPDTIAADGFVGSWTSVQWSPSGGARVTYFTGFPNYDLRYAERVDGNWETTTIDTAGSTGYNAVFGCAPDQEPVLLFSSIQAGLLSATRSETGWSVQTVESGPFVGSCLQVSLDSVSRAHIAYTADGNFKYAIRVAPGVFTSEVIEANSGCVEALALDAGDNPWVLSQDGYTTQVWTRRHERWFSTDLHGLSGNVSMNRTLDGRIGIAFTRSDSVFFGWLQTSS